MSSVFLNSSEKVYRYLCTGMVVLKYQLESCGGLFPVVKRAAIAPFLTAAVALFLSLALSLSRQLSKGPFLRRAMLRDALF